MSDGHRDPIMPSLDPDEEPTDANPVPLSPTDPARRTEENPEDATDPSKAPDPRVVPVAPGTGGVGGAAGSPIRPAAR